ncbi:MAG: type II toxin-antitoxin system HicB family antitoxin [Bacteriovoracaceae bacterium]|nr:type II toxin-antitoxin system HicB family antitoxin [Bacteriovoracaceae bacterium]
MKYFAKITKQKNHSYVVEFPQLIGCLTEGKNIIQAQKNAHEALNGWLISNCDRKLNIPEPKILKSPHHYPIDVEPSIAFAIMLRKIRQKKGITQTDLAKKLKISQQAYAKLETPLITNPSLKTIDKISEALDVKFYFDLVA